MAVDIMMVEYQDVGLPRSSELADWLERRFMSSDGDIYIEEKEWVRQFNALMRDDPEMAKRFDAAAIVIYSLLAESECGDITLKVLT